MRIKSEKKNISYQATHEFFYKRAKKFNEDNPYCVTMYQDNHPEIVQARNEKEIERILPLLCLDKESKVLDVACGVGRWSDAITTEIAEYCGIDFCKEFIDIAIKRNDRENSFFFEGASNEIEDVLKKNNKGRYNVVLLIGILMYLNDGDIVSCLEQVERVCEEHAIICIREPIGIENRLTLKEYYSEELKDNYNAIYRSKEELNCFLEKTLFNKGFRIAKEEFLFEGELNNRKETAQYYYILKR